jgi:hypothetical protein
MGLIYYSLRTLFLFKRNVAAKDWVYICLSAIFSSMGVVAFLVESLTSMGLLPVGGVLETVGASFTSPRIEEEFPFLGEQRPFRLINPSSIPFLW